ncbi:Metaxin-1 [Hyphodiscus hymeniophilus]|uniref:Metaxin-1 n=1 Tax=Hyphodiscus hymeniophilus TaxID=353542 RepID=A0A9P6SL18_9HELO|nr:Metaxin-1 [Hyphodiscus hymeniophilus]
MPPEILEEVEDSAQSSPFTRRTQKVRSFFSIPAPVKTLFDQVPILTYPANHLPQRAPKPSRIPTLYVFAREGDAPAGRPSFNPSCLKWQTFLNIAGINHRLISSNNHASPAGRLPFLLPSASTSTSESIQPVWSNKFVRYAAEHGGRVYESPSMRYEAYQSLLDHRILNAWLELCFLTPQKLYNLYLDPNNFSAVAYPLYISPVSSNPLVRASIAHQLRTAAETELLKHTSIIDTDDLYSEADKALEALSILLGEDPWFFGNEKPALFDASMMDSDGRRRNCVER